MAQREDLAGADPAHCRRTDQLARTRGSLRSRGARGRRSCSTHPRSCFVLPVIYDGCALDGLDEATIYHMGVSPAHRGTGSGRLLLRHATRLLVEHGVWRIYCDTPSNNEPMIHLFESDGWTRLPAHERPIAV